MINVFLVFFLAALYSIFTFAFENLFFHEHLKFSATAIELPVGCAVGLYTG